MTSTLPDLSTDLDYALAMAAAIATTGDAVTLRAYISSLPTETGIAVDMTAEAAWTPETVTMDAWIASTDLSEAFQGLVTARRDVLLSQSQGPADRQDNPIVDISYLNGAQAPAMPARAMRWAPMVGVASWAYTSPAESARSYRGRETRHVSGATYLMPRAR